MVLQVIKDTGPSGAPDRHGTSIEDFDEWLELIQGPNQLIFRGQRKSWPLLPRVIDGFERGSILQKERELLEDFKKEVIEKQCLQVLPKTDWDWLVVAQHHGLPTRLLDWSYDPYVALWFALKDFKKNYSRPEVWVLKAEKVDIIQSKKSARPFSGTRTKVFETDFMIPRLIAQKGCFTLFKHVEKSRNGFVQLERNKVIRKRLERIRIAQYASEPILKHLQNKRYTQEFLFPDIDEIAKRLKNNKLGNFGIKKYA